MADEKYSNQSARLASMYRDTFAPILYNIEQAFSHNLTTGTTDIRFDAGAMIKGDLASQVTIAATAVAGAAIMTPNEARAFIGLTRIEGEGMDEVGHTSAPPAPPSQPGDREGEEATDDGNLGDMPDE
jgi:phage portal protein BeeE